MKWRVNFFDKHSNETRTLTVEATDENNAETKGESEADAKGWPKSFKISDVEEID